MAQGDRILGERFNAAIFFIISITHIFCSFYYGGVTPSGLFGVQILTGVAVILWFVRLVSTKEYIVCRTSLLFPLLIFGCIIMTSFFYSIYPFGSKVEIVRYVSYLFIYGVIVNSLRKDIAQRLLHILVVIAFCVAVFGLVSFFLKRYDLLLYTKIFYRNRLNATFINPNHFACYVNLIIFVAIYFFIQSVGLRRKIFYGITLFVFVSSLMLTFSHAGIIAFITGLSYFCGFGYKNKVLTKRFVFYNIFFLFCALTIYFIIGVYVNAPFISLSAFKSHKLYSYVTHLLLWKGCLLFFNETIMTVPLRFIWGYGLGTFSLVYNVFHPVLSLRYALHAHNQFFEACIELGLIGMALFMYMWGAAFRNVIIGIGKESHEGKILYVCLGAAFFAFFVHLFFDFNWQINANVLLLFSLFAVGDVQAEQSPIRLKDALYIRLIISGILIIYFFTVTQVFLSEVFLQSAIKHVHSNDFLQSELNFNRALKIDRTNAEVYREYAEMYLARAKNAKSEDNREHLLEQAKRYFESAIMLKPREARYYARLAELFAFAGDYENAEKNYSQAVMLAPKLFIAYWHRILFYLSNDNPQFEKAIMAYEEVLDSFHPFTFQDRSEKQAILGMMEAQLMEVPDSEKVNALRRRISREMAPIDQY